MDKKEIEEAYQKMQIVSEEAKEIQQQISLLNMQHQELFKILEGIDSLKGKQPDSSLLTNLGAGVFFKTKIEDCRNLLVNVGAETVIEENIDSVRSRIASQLMEIEAIIHEFESSLQKRIQDVQKLQNLFAKE